MEAIRKIVTVRNNALNVVLPDHFNNREVELIILPTESLPQKVEESQTNYYSKFYGSIKSGLTQEEIDKKLKDLRDEWNRDIF